MSPLGDQASSLQHDFFQPLVDGDGLLTIAGFGSLLSQRSARSTFPDLMNFRTRRVQGWRRVFAHTAAIFFERGIAREATMEISSLSCEPCDGQDIVVACFEVPWSEAACAAFIEREHEFKFAAVQALDMDGTRDRRAVLCSRWTDEEYKAARCPPAEFQRRYGTHGIERVWRDDVLPCRIYLRHCVLAAEGLGAEAHRSFLDDTFLADRVTTVRQHLAADPSIMATPPPESLQERYGG